MLFLCLYAAFIALTQAEERDGFCETVKYKPVGEPLFSVTSQDPLTWLGMRSQCYAEHIGYYLSAQFEDLPPEVVALCPAGSLVPFPILLVDGEFVWDNVNEIQHQPLSPHEASVLNVTFVDKKGPHGALLWPSTDLRMVDNETKFTCAVCEMFPRRDAVTNGVYPSHDNSIFAYDLELVSYSRIKSVDLVANGSDLTNKLLGDLAKVFNISAKALLWHGAKLNVDGKAVVHVYYDPGDVQVAGDLDIKRGNNQFVVKECFWDVIKDTAVWTKPIIWESVCYKKDLIQLGKIFSLNGTNFTKELRNIDARLSIDLQYVANGQERIYSLRGFVLFVNSIALLHKLQRPYATLFNLLAYSIPVNTAKIAMRMPLEDNRTTDLGTSALCNVMISDRDDSDPVVGLAISLSDPRNGTQQDVAELTLGNMTLVPNTSHIVVTVSDSIATTAIRLAIGTFAAHLDLPNQTNMYDDSIDGWIALVQVAFSRDNPSLGNLHKDFVDIAFKPKFHLPTLRGKCAERNLTTDEWFGDSCRILKSMRDEMMVCRCKNLYRDGNLTNGVYIIYGFDARLSTFLANNLTLVIVMVFVCFMSALGLLSVILTVVFFPEWREDQGHKIFLQMILALTVNLFLGFVNNFVNIDTKSVACIGIGVVRHYSFLAMFFWMVVLSGLQVKRLTTIAGAKATTHLILKVSCIAWGLPLVPIVILLAWDTGFYKSQVSNRGYCYPEDVAFQATVQGPAGVILFVNLIIFVVILNHIYGWVKCNKDVVVRKHDSNDRAAQLRNLGNSIFIFFLFGFTWTFHFLSKEGIINSEFLFEFLFLITASFHLFMLSLFFIVLDKKTRTLWRNALGCRRKRKLNRRHKPKNNPTRKKGNFVLGNLK